MNAGGVPNDKRENCETVGWSWLIDSQATAFSNHISICISLISPKRFKFFIYTTIFTIITRRNRALFEIILYGY
jgi:hypothetical protein